MKPTERVTTSMNFKEPDKIPLIQSLTFYGAKELKMSIKDYFSSPEHIVEGQVKMQKKYQSDSYLAFMYASAELEAFGGSTIFVEEGPPNAGAPVINSFNDIETLVEPDIDECISLQRVLQITRLLKHESNGDIPVMGVVVSPFSLPIMQMGFSNYFDLLFHRQDLFWKLMDINKRFCIKWAGLQIEAGADAIGYSDPFSSPLFIDRQLFHQTGWVIAREVIQAINATTAINLASGTSLPIMNELIETGANIVAVSSKEDIVEAKKIAYNRVALVGNLNGIEMCRWDEVEAENAVKNIINGAGKGGGLIISDNHGEIPYQVPEKVLLAIAHAVEKYGTY